MDLFFIVVAYIHTKLYTNENVKELGTVVTLFDVISQSPSPLRNPDLRKCANVG